MVKVLDSWAGRAGGTGRVASRKAEKPIRRLNPITLGRDKSLCAAVGVGEEESTLKRYSGVKAYLTLPGALLKVRGEGKRCRDDWLDSDGNAIH